MAVIDRLPTNYKDREWQGNRKFQLINNDDGTVSLVDKTEYTVEEESYFGAKQLNTVGEAYNAMRDSITQYFFDIVIPANSFTLVSSGYPSDRFPWRYFVANSVIDENSTVSITYSQPTIDLGIMASNNGKTANGGFYIYASANNKTDLRIDQLEVERVSKVEYPTYATSDQLREVAEKISNPITIEEAKELVKDVWSK